MPKINRPTAPVHRAVHTTALVAVLALAAVLAGTGCARAVGIESEPGPTYRIEVVNNADRPMIVSYDDGSGERLLGTVPAERQEWFTIANPASRTVEIIAADSDRERAIRRSVTLGTDEQTRVILPD